MEEERRAKEALEALLPEKGYRLYEVHYRLAKEGPKLEVVVDRDEPISLEDIVSLSDFVSQKLDEADPIQGPYTLDLSSAGAEKSIPLDQLEKAIGKYVNLHLSHPYRGENILEGTLTAIQEGNVTLLIKAKGKKKEAIFPEKDIDKARYAIEF
ncbi:MAG: hypothetical protein J6038_00035 [Bacilli bacterium]|nr:hypothetical protein [Bacilli bacterium]